jgi:hypothetical protein
MINKTVFLNDVLFSLHGAHQLGWPALRRTHIQRILYFCAALCGLSNTEWGYEFSNTPYGPFNRDISTAPNKLVYQRYADVIEVAVFRDSRMRATFQITESGKERIKLITTLKRESIRLSWIRSVMEILTIYGPSVTSKLAYLEPTFNRMKQENRSGAIDLSADENESMHLLLRLNEELKRTYSIDLDTQTSNLILYFDFLSRDIGRSVE